MEINPRCQQVLYRHFPTAHAWADVTQVHGGLLPPVDVITFGSPCQDMSIAGAREGLDGDRSVLFFEATRIIGEMREATQGRSPRFAVWENVDGARSSHAGRDFARVLGEFRQRGALDLGWRVVDSQWFGLAQGRERVFLVADFGGQCAGEVLALSQSLRGDPPPRRSTGPGAAAAAEGGARSSGVGLRPISHALTSGGHDAMEDGTGRGVPIVAVPALATTLTGRYAKGTDSDATATLLAFNESQITSRQNAANPRPGQPAPTLAANRYATTIAFLGTDDGHDARAELSPTLRSGNGRGRNPMAVAFTERTRPEGRTLECQEELAYALTDPGSGGKAHSRAIAHAISGGNGRADLGYTLKSSNEGGRTDERVIHDGWRIRRLTPRECERLQGFPDDWTAVGADGKPLSDSARYQALGNAVSVPVARWLGTNLLAALDMEGLS